MYLCSQLINKTLMKKQIITLILAIATCMLGFAQTNTIPNAGFEEWSNNAPDYWQTSFNMTIVIIPISYKAGVPSEDAHSGNYSLLLTTQNVSAMGSSIALPGFAQLGEFNTDSLLGLVTTFSEDPYADLNFNSLVKGGAPFNTIPTNVKLWAKYLPDTIPSDMIISAIAVKSNDLTGDQIIAQGSFQANEAITEFKEITIPMKIEVEDETPDFLNIIISSANTYNCGEDSLWVDDVTVELESGIYHLNSLDFSIMPNPTSDYLSIQLDNNREFSVEIYDLNGKKVLENNNCTNTTRLNVSTLSAGSYIAKVMQDNNISSRKIIIK